ncbi:hypothetical protein MNBD_GAMMA04-1281, partial [hydrothermal vent metagenome]
VSAQRFLGLVYLTGKGVKRDDKAARHWLLQAAKQGDVMAQYNLGLVLAYGRGGGEDFTQAVKWLKKASKPQPIKLKPIDALGQSLHQGFKVADKWYQKAAEQDAELVLVRR